VLLSLVLLYLFTLTPVGRLTLGLAREQPPPQVPGYDVHVSTSRHSPFSAMFAGVAGGRAGAQHRSANYVLLEGQVSAAVVLKHLRWRVSVFLVRHWAQP